MAMELEEKVKLIAKDLGFDDCRFTKAKEATHAQEFQKWLNEDKNGDMEWMENNPERRKDPRLLVEGASTVIVLALNYFPTEKVELNKSGVGRFAKYAWGNDYHNVIDKKLKNFAKALEELGGEQRFYVDYGPILERDFATDAGVGWNGKSTVQIHPKLGTWFFLAELVTTLNLNPDQPMPNRCGTCTKCIDCCPTDAITAPNKMDPRRCISYFTIEHKGSIPLEFRESIGDRVFCCDDCLEVCPWNRFAKASKEAKFATREFVGMSLIQFLGLNGNDFMSLFRKSPVKRLGRERFLRNVCIAIGNSGKMKDIPHLRKVINEESELIKEHAKWAIDAIKSRSSLVHN